MLSSLFYKLFVEIADTGNISIAADNMTYSQSGLSHAINRAEEELGFKLFKRTKSGVALTEESKTLLPLARQVVTSMNKMDESISFIQKLTKSHIKIGAYASVSMHFLPKLLKAFTSNYPGITIEIIEGSRNDFQRLLADNSISVAFTSLVPEDPFEQIPLFDDPIVAVFPKGTAVETDEHQRFALENLNQYSFILPIMDNTIDFDVEHAIKRNHLHFSHYVSSLDYITIMCMVRSGLGVSLIPELFTFDFVHDVSIRYTQPQSYRTIGMELSSNVEHSLAVSEFIKHVKSYMLTSFMTDHQNSGLILRYDQNAEVKPHAPTAKQAIYAESKTLTGPPFE